MDEMHWDQRKDIRLISINIEFEVMDKRIRIKMWCSSVGRQMLEARNVMKEDTCIAQNIHCWPVMLAFSYSSPRRHSWKKKYDCKSRSSSNLIAVKSKIVQYFGT